jgi:coenzyme F420-reducing hydrogenase gamma subunit
MKRDRKKPCIGVWKFTCCSGCQFNLLFFQESLKETLENVRFEFFYMGRESNSEKGPFDIALVEGGVSESHQIEELKRIRVKSHMLVAFGQCAVDGGIPSIKNRTPELEVQGRAYGNPLLIQSNRVQPIDSYVHVDAYLRGCPFEAKELLEVISAYKLGRRPNLSRASVCAECKMKDNLCILVAKGEPCMGPVTNGGCGALCPSVGRPCYSCHGPMDDPNARALAKLFEEQRLSPKDIVRKFSEFGGLTLAFRKAIDQYER